MPAPRPTQSGRNRGPAPPASPPRPVTDADGNIIVGAAQKEDNIYIPKFIAETPFYLAGVVGTGDSLQHQRARKREEAGHELALERTDRRLSDTIQQQHQHQQQAARTKWIKGACENCGALGHQRKHCLERPRKVGAKWSGSDIKPDRTSRDPLGGGRAAGWDVKRDKYRGYDAAQYGEVVEEYNLVEEARRRAQENGGVKADDDHDGEGDEANTRDYEAGFKYGEETDMGRDKATTKSMRIREDTAKYLVNLDTDSAKYNPKKRALVDAGAMADQSAALFAEENFLRGTGEAAEMEQAQRYAWELQERQGDSSLHLQANPTTAALLRRHIDQETRAKRQRRDEALRTQYGEQRTMPSVLRQLAVGAEKEVFVEYDEAGLVKGKADELGRSKYVEDVFANNHSSVWGSWWVDFQWGYACCHSLVKNSYCTGELGKEAAKEQRDKSW